MVQVYQFNWRLTKGLRLDGRLQSNQFLGSLLFSQPNRDYTKCQRPIRELYAPHVDVEIYPPAVAISSTHNTVIESFWRWLREKSGLNLKDIIIRGKLEQRFHVYNQHHQ